MSLDDLIPENAGPTQGLVDVEDLQCPNCQTDNINVINKSMANCKNDNCVIYNFDPLPDDE